MVAEYAASVGGIQSAGLKFAGMKPVSPSMALHRQSVVGHMARDVLPNADAVASPLIRGQTQRLLAASLLGTFLNTALDALTDSPVGEIEPTALRRAVAFIDAHAGEGIGIAQIAEAARGGPRGLQQAFRRYRDTTPTQYLHRIRLDHAHRELFAGHPSRGDTVSTHDLLAQYLCYTPGDGGTWTFLRNASTGEQGWVRDDLLAGDGSQVPCEENPPPAVVNPLGG